MADQLTQHTRLANGAGQPNLRHSHTALTAPRPGRNAQCPDAMSQALSCLETSKQTLKKGRAEHADEILNLLRAAAAHLEQALAPESLRDRHRGLSGAE